MNALQGGFSGSPKGDSGEISSYDPVRPRLFREMSDKLGQVLGKKAVRVDHVGSTAVPGLSAKPMIDVQVSVSDLEDEGAHRLPLESSGLVLRYRGEERRFFRPPESEPRTMHVHVCESRSRAEREHFLFAAYLLSHPERRDEYGALKRDLAREFHGRREEYLAAKEPFIQQTLELAEESQSRTGESL